MVDARRNQIEAAHMVNEVHAVHDLFTLMTSFSFSQKKKKKKKKETSHQPTGNKI